MDNKYYIWLTLLHGFGTEKIHELLSQYDNEPEKIYKSVKSEVKISEAEEIIAQCEESEIHIITIDDERYPQQLKHIYNPPIVLYAKGNIDALGGLPAITIVGARTVTDYSSRIARSFAHELSKAGFTINSGFAVGVDILSQTAALMLCNPTVAVLGCGINVNYPPENNSIRKLMTKIGCFLSEYPPNMPTHSAHFRRRNAILSGLSDGTLVIQASKKSGSLITANLALEQGKDVFCIPPASLFDESYAGVIPLLRDGAMSVYNHFDIIAEYSDKYEVLDIAHLKDEYTKIKKNKKPIVVKTKRKENAVSAAVSASAVAVEEPVVKKEIDYGSLSENQVVIMKMLEENPLAGDVIIEKSGLKVSDVLSDLTTLEIMGYVEAMPGKRYRVVC
jgi:DNA processing protein